MVESNPDVARRILASSSHALPDGTAQASGLHLYVDGRTVGLTTVANSLSGATTNTAPFTIGNTGDGSNTFEGSIAGVAVYNTALTAAQIQQLSEDAAIARNVLSQFASSGGWLVFGGLFHQYRHQRRLRSPSPSPPTTEAR